MFGGIHRSDCLPTNRKARKSTATPPTATIAVVTGVGRSNDRMVKGAVTPTPQRTKNTRTKKMIVLRLDMFIVIRKTLH